MIVNGQKITPKEFVKVARNFEPIKISSNLKKKISEGRKIVKQIIEEGKVVYGISTGFGAFKNKFINKKDTEQLQENLILSHSVGVGNYFPTEVVRGMMFLMVNYLSKGNSGIKWETVNTLAQMLNKKVHPLVPEKGSVGSSGDLAPSAHIALVLIGKGEAEYKGKSMTGSEAMKLAGIKKVKLSSKEGLAIINNTAAMTSVSLLLLYDTEWLIKLSSINASLSLQALKGTDKAYDSKIHNLKPHEGQIETAKELRELLKGSSFIDRKRIQEAYSFRCVPQVHGAIREAYKYVEKVVKTEANSVTDNPLIFSDNQILSGGNFHGEPVAIAMDTLGIALSELGNISERRLSILLDPNLNNGLPAFLIEDGGLNSGLMITQYLAASLVSENKVLSHPASVDSIPTSANIEDIVSMGTIAARKAREIFENTATILAIELMAACQAIDLRIKTDKSLKLSQKTKKVFEYVREIVPYFNKDTIYYPLIINLRKNLEKIANLV